MATCTFATTCWERDWEQILLDPTYLANKQIAHHGFPFQETLLIINNVSDLPRVKEAAEKKVQEKVISRYVVACEIVREVLSFFELEEKDFRPIGVPWEWVYFNALGPLCALYETKSDYLLYMTGDVYLEKKVRWIEKALRFMQKNGEFKVANLLWNGRKKEALRESFRRTWNFYLAEQGFSDQMFLVRREDFRKPIYQEVREDSMHYPRGDVFEKRAFSAMKNRGWKRLTYRWGSYVHPEGK